MDYAMQFYKHTLFTILLLFVFMPQSRSWAQADTTVNSQNYEQQRKRVNELLEKRKKRFGDFEVSTKQKTGIFGVFKTKKDMQKSMDILREIILADNRILDETRKLLDIKDYESDHNAALASSFDAQITAHMRTIAKLREENDKLLSDNNLKQKKQTGRQVLLYSLIAVVLLQFLIIIKIYKRNSSKF